VFGSGGPGVLLGQSEHVQDLRAILLRDRVVEPLSPEQGADCVMGPTRDVGPLDLDSLTSLRGTFGRGLVPQPDKLVSPILRPVPTRDSSGVRRYLTLAWSTYRSRRAWSLIWTSDASATPT
jgi:hypothetical protein